MSFRTSRSVRHGNTPITILVGDITDQDTDAIVNAANSSLAGGGGVDGAIHRKAGVRLEQECMDIIDSQYPSGLPPGEAVITSGGRLKAHYVIHTVGPIWRGTSADEATLRACYLNSLSLADQMRIRSISFPSISTGAFGYPVERAAAVAVRAVKDFLNRRAPFEELRFVLYDMATFEVYSRAYDQT